MSDEELITDQIVAMAEAFIEQFESQRMARKGRIKESSSLDPQTTPNIAKILMSRTVLIKQKLQAG